MSRRGVWLRLVFVLAVLLGSGALAYTQQPTLGLDLEGGSSITLEVKEEEAPGEVTPEDVDNTVEVLRNRVNALGVSEPTIARQGEDRILVELPGVRNEQEVKETLQQTAQLTVHPVRGVVQSQDAEPSSANGTIIPAEGGEFIEVGPSRIAGDEIGSANAQQPQNQSNYVVSIDFANGGGDTWQQLTARARCNTQDVPRPSGDPKRRIAIVLDGEAISSPEVADSVGCAGIAGGSTQITGQFSLQQARDLAVLIEGGALPVPLEIINFREVGPTLGEEAIDASFESAVIGLVLTGLFILLVYRGVGLLATLALASYALIAYAVLVGLGATLTLPGLAGFVLAIGMAIDANVLVFERAREEYAEDQSRGLRRSLTIGFNKAWSAIIDSNVTTLLAAGLLFALATGPVQGFGVTLAIGVLASMFSALVIARVLTDLGVNSRLARRRPGLTGIGSLGRIREWLDRKRPDLVARRALWVTISGVVLVASLGGIVFKGLDLGVEFSGGRVVEYSTTQDIGPDVARDAVADAGFPEATVQSSEDNIVVRTGELSNQEQNRIEQSLTEVGGEVSEVQDQEVGPSLGEELRNKALLAFGIALAAQMAYLALRFKWTFGISAVLAMFHDVIIVTGLFAWLDKPIDGVFLAAALTIIGLSVNDTVVVFDRVREHWRGSQGTTFAQEASRACVQTLPRTLYTSLSTMFILGALALLGGDSLQDFSIALLVGLLVGTYSSVFLAAPLVSYLHQKWPMRRSERIKQDRDPDDTGAVV